MDVLEGAKKIITFLVNYSRLKKSDVIIDLSKMKKTQAKKDVLIIHV